MGIQDFLLAVATASQKYAGVYGLDPKELQFALLANAGVEGGLGDTTGVGDGGYSFGRYQLNTTPGSDGHGESLLKQGYTLEQITDDAFQANYWAPHLAKNLAAVKAAGYTGGELLRQAVFQAEQPFEMYPAERFNASLAQASGLMGGAPRVSQAGGNAVDGDIVSQSRAALQKRVSDAIQKYGQTNAEADYMELQKALFDLGTFEDAQPAGGGDNDPAQKAFDNAIKLGDFNSKEADRLYSRWRDKNAMARDAAVGQIESANATNEAQSKLTQTIFDQGPQSSGKTLLPPRYEDALARWNEKFGAGNEPAPSFNSGLGLPGAPGFQPEPTPPAEGTPVSPVEAARQSFINTDRALDTTSGAPPPREPSTWDKLGGLRNDSGEATLFGRTGGQWGDAANRAAQITTGVFNPRAGAAAASGAAAKKAKKWWNTGGLAKYTMGVPKYAEGTLNHPGGPALVNENGPETVITPQFGPQQMPGGAHVANLPPGSAVIPSGVPLDEAYAFSQIRQGLERPDADQDPQGQYERANDPDLQAKVLAAMQKAMASNWAANPPKTPVLRGQWDKDPWADLRGLSGVPASEQEYMMQQEAAAKGGR